MEASPATSIVSDPALGSIFCGILFIIVSIPLLRGTIPMNHFYGFRIRKAFTSDENWYAINRYGARQMIFWSTLMAVSGIVLLFTHISPSLKIAPLILFTAIPVIKTMLFARTLT